jgi:hypothetical protein
VRRHSVQPTITQSIEGAIRLNILATGSVAITDKLELMPAKTAGVTVSENI